jgi:hypothetical protein
MQSVNCQKEESHYFAAKISETKQSGVLQLQVTPELSNRKK